MKKLITVFLIGLIASFAVIASPAGAKKGKAHGLAGVVQSVGTNSITLKPRKGDPVTVQVNGDTNFMPVLADVKVLPEHLVETRRKLAEAWPSV